MKIKRFIAPDMRQAIRSVSRELGADAVIISNRQVKDGVEVVAAIDFDESLFSPAAAKTTSTEKESSTPAGIDTASTQSVNHTSTGKLISQKQISDVVSFSDTATAEIRKDLDGLRHMLETRLAGLAWDTEQRRNPTQVAIMRQLAQLGFSTDLCRQHCVSITEGSDFNMTWSNVLAAIANDILLDQNDITELGGLVSLVGPTGVGKTTTIAKLAAKYVLRHGRQGIALVTTDSYRIGAYEQLRSYGRILDIPVFTTADANELADTINMLHDKDLVLVDTAGIGQRDDRLHQQLEMIQLALPESRNYLVLSAASQREIYDEIIQAYQTLPLSACIMTKLDEASRLGGLLSAVINHRIPLAYINDGQRVPEDIHRARSEDLLIKAVAMVKDDEFDVHDELIEQAFRGNSVNASV